MFVFFLIVRNASAQNALQLFTKDLLHENNADQNFVGSGATGQPQGGYIYRFYLNVTGDAKPAVFLASSLSASGSDLSWSVYRQGSAESAQLLAKGLQLSPTFYISAQPGKTVIARLISARHQPDRILYDTIASNGGYFHQEKVVGNTEIPQNLPSTASTEDGYIKFLGLGQKVHPKIEKILLSQYLAENASSWRPYDKRHDATHQYLDDGDATYIEANKHFDFSKAKEN